MLYFSYDVISLGLSDLRKDPVYTTVCIILNTVVMGKTPFVLPFLLYSLPLFFLKGREKEKGL